MSSLPLILTAILITWCNGDTLGAEAPPASPPSGDFTGTVIQSRDMTRGEIWVERLERPDRLAGLRIDDVIEALELRDGTVVADIGAGSGAFTLPFARAVGPTGRVLAVEIWPELLEFIAARAESAGLGNINTILCAADDPKLPKGVVDLAYFHDVFHNVPDRQAYLRRLASYLKPDARIVIIEQEYDDPIARKWDVPEDRITAEQVDAWMTNVGFELIDEFNLFQGDENPLGAGMPERWFVVYARAENAGGPEPD